MKPPMHTHQSRALLRRASTVACRRWLGALLAGLVILGAESAQAKTATKLAADILRITDGRRTKIIWMRGVKGNHCLMAFDTNEGTERVLHPGPENNQYIVPEITPDGSRVVYTRQNTAYAIDWAGKKERMISSGFVCAAGEDPKDKSQLVYVSASGYAPPVFRIKIDNPEDRVQVWNGGTSINFNASADGTHLGGEFGWPHAGVVDVATGVFKRYGGGCNSRIAPDNSYRFWHMTGEHRVVHIYEFGGGGHRSIPVNSMPGIDGQTDAWIPRWSNKVRFFTVTAPNPWGKPSRHVNVYMGKFDEGLTKVTDWVQISNDAKQDDYAYAWVEGSAVAKARKEKNEKEDKAAEARKRAAEARKRRLDAEAEKKAAEEKKWLSARGRAVFLWETADKPVLAYDKKGRRNEGFNLIPRGLARLDHDQAMDVRNGSFIAEDATAHILSSCRKSGRLGLEAYITPADLSAKGTAMIISFSTKDGRQNFALAQKQGGLVFGLKATGQKGSWIRLFALEEGRPCHVIVTYRRGMLVCYRDGRTVMMNNEIKGSLRNWKVGELVFGDNLSGKRNWDGTIESVVVYAYFVDTKAAALNYRNYKALVEKRTPVPKLKVVVKLLAKSAAPKYEDIAPYFQALSVYEYKVKLLMSGDYDKKNIRVAHWTMIQKKPAAIARARVGSTTRLLLEPFEANRQLEAEFLSDAMPPEADLPLYYDVGRW